MLYLVPTPIGNLEDMTERSLKALRGSAAVFCEDTRRTRKLFSHFGISTPLLRYNEHDERSRQAVLTRLHDGEDIAVVSDSGTPCVSDPGRRIAAMARDSGVAVTALPGASAVTTALAGSGFPADSFVFLGFLPRTSSKRVRALGSAAALGKTIVVYESPYRVLATLADAEAALGAGCRACVARELTKVHEEWLRGTVAEARSLLGARPELLGEFVLLFHQPPPASEEHRAPSGTAALCRQEDKRP
ncbi:MAG: 16S rRNA (cytidine(1402)-2'-O)-methyltransferase [Elusimicrobia bacterium]|nr:16S rRNA (cytidine(1402)-2'-O)-methyltransferase [Elusimicrobiota bacterium]